MNTAYLLTGGNIGDRLHFLQQAASEINRLCGRVVQASAVYETEAWGLTDQQHFLNQALEIETELKAIDLLDCTLKIEEKLGRKRLQKFGPRTIDIDLLFFNDEVITTGRLQVPHPQLPNRRFALQCLNDIAAQKTHPVLHKTIAQLLQSCTDPLKARLFTTNEG